MTLKYLNHPARKGLESDYSGTTIAVPANKLAEAKRRIKEFRRSFSSWIAQDNEAKTDVYRMNVQFFPLKNFDSKN